MNASTAVARIQAQMKALESLTIHDIDNAFELWKRSTRDLLEAIFGEDSKQVQDFQKVRFTPIRMPTIAASSGRYGKTSGSTQPSEHDKSTAFTQGKKRMVIELTALSDKISTYGLTPAHNSLPILSEPIELVRKICSRFDRVVGQLQHRHEERPAFIIRDEYDVQDLLHALLVLHFDDVRPEETGPSHAAKRPRTDFLLKREQIVIEVKKTRDTLKAGVLADQLIVDIARYKAHPDCKVLVCFVYDPDKYVDNPQGLIHDLTKNHDGLEVIVIVAPTG